MTSFGAKFSVIIMFNLLGCSIPDMPQRTHFISCEMHSLVHDCFFRLVHDSHAKKLARNDYYNGAL